MEEPNITPSFTGDIPTVENEIISNCVIHFRPDQNWNGSEYGFDWIRIGDSNMPVDQNNVNHHYANLMGKYYGFGNLPTTLHIGPKPSVIKTMRWGVCDDLNDWRKMTVTNNPTTFKNEIALYRDLVSRYFHKRLTISWKMGKPSICPASLDADIKTEIDNTQYTYYVPVMTLMLDKTANLKMLCELNPSDPPPTKVEIFEKLEVGESPCFEFLNGTEKKDNPSDMTKYSLDVKCIDTFSEEKLIEAYATYPDGTKKLCGQLRVLPNYDVLKLNILLIEVHIDGIGNPGRIAVTAQDEVILKRILGQAMIDVTHRETYLFKLSSTNYPVFYNKIVGYTDTSPHITGRFFPRKHENHIAGPISAAFNQHLSSRGETQRYANYIKILIMDIPCKSPIMDNGGNYTGRDDQANGVTYYDSGYIILYRDRGNDTYAHEMLHALGLAHPYVGKELDKNALYTYKARTTDNIMDYSHQIGITRKTTWQWQWSIERSHVRQQQNKERKRITAEAVERAKNTIKPLPLPKPAILLPRP